MKIQFAGLVFIDFLFLFTLALSVQKSVFSGDPSVSVRFTDIEKQCHPFLSSASELDPDSGYRLINELSFLNGNWEQDKGGAPLIPYEDSAMPMGVSPLTSPLKLVGFEVEDVSPIQTSKKALSLRGTMCIGISRNSPLDCDMYSNFGMYPGMSAFKIDFEGVYIETNENGGERVVCMMGNSTFPFWELVDDSLNMIDGIWVSSVSKRQPRVFPNDQVLLVLRYPKAFNLTSRAIHGEMRSLNDRGNFKYFDSVHLSTQFSRFFKYQFNSEELRSTSCDLNLYQDEFVEDGVIVFNRSDFCQVLGTFGNEAAFNVMPNWKFIGRKQYYSRLGPFLLGEEFKAPDWSYKKVKFIMQNLICEQKRTEDKANNARVSAVLRAFPATMERDTAALRTDISADTMSVEGLWNSSTGLLCMIGCLGDANLGLKECDSRISLYFPRSFSTTRRSFIYGSLSSISESYFPTLFEAETSPSDVLFIYGWYGRSYLSYNYSKTDHALAFRKRSQPSNVITFIKKSLFVYPATRCKEEAISHFDPSRDLQISDHAVSHPSCGGNKPDTYVQIDMLSLGSLFGSAPSLCRSGLSVTSQPELYKSSVLNVSLYLKFADPTLPFFDKSFKSISTLFLEGIYDLAVGEMYLTACRKVVAERNPDCSIEVKIEYPPKETRWLFNPTPKITITSQRDEDDPLHFGEIRLRTFIAGNQLAYVFRSVFEVILWNLMLSLENTIIWSQLLYMKRKVNVIPCISVVMPAIQVLGYSLPLISNVKIPFNTDNFVNRIYNIHGYGKLLKVLDYTRKLLGLTAFLLLASILQKVYGSRRQSYAHLASKTRGLHPEIQVLLITLSIHVVGYLTLLLVEDIKLEVYASIVQDFFLLPQITGNFCWQTTGKPLRKFYFFGLTFTRLLLHLYDFIRDPIVDPFTGGRGEEPRIVNGSSISNISHVAVIVTMIVFVVVIYLQQKSNKRLKSQKSQ